jgi:hypothetical protein
MREKEERGKTRPYASTSNEGAW